MAFTSTPRRARVIWVYESCSSFLHRGSKSRSGRVYDLTIRHMKWRSVFWEEADLESYSTTIAFFPSPKFRPSICKIGVSVAGGLPHGLCPITPHRSPADPWEGFELDPASFGLIWAKIVYLSSTR